MNVVKQVASDVVSEARMRGMADDPEWLAVIAMNYVQARVRAWREEERVAVGAGFTQYVPAILALGAGYCGGNVVAFRAVLGELGIKTRQVEFAWDGVGHVAVEAWWDNRWHFMDVQNGTFWRHNNEIPSVRAVQKLGDVEERFRVSNRAWLEYGGVHEPFASAPFAYLRARDVNIVDEATPARVAAVGSLIRPALKGDPVVPIKVTAALAWFDEPLQQLEDCVRGVAVLADRLVAVDGGYARYPGAEPSSPEEQARVIEETCREVGLDVEVHVPDRLWAGQVEKRTFLLEKTVEGMTPADWFMAVDADHIWHGPRYSIRAELQRLPSDVVAVEVPMFTPMNYDRPLEQSAAGTWHENHADKVMSPQRIFRCLPEPKVERYHWWYSALLGGKRVWLWGGDHRFPKVETVELGAPMLVEHRCLFREEKQIVRNREFCDDRVGIVRRTGQEDDQAVREVVAA